MSVRNDFVSGDWLVTCSMCGLTLYASSAVKNWQGLWRHPHHNEPRQPQDFVRGVKDVQTVPFAQPPNDEFIDITKPTVCTLVTKQGLPGYAMPGCAIPSFINPLPPIP